ncbi:MAG: hypothetical protein FWG37_05220 [Clostridia bacterium]|nr:hypothetical protein [Clostridia bacterium]
MGNVELSFENFLLDVPPTQRPFVDPIHALLVNQCTVKLQMAKSGYVVSYVCGKNKRVVANFIFRKQGLLLRIYGDHCDQYQPLIDGLPDAMKAEIEKTAVCRRLLDPTRCNARCPMGNRFTLRGTEHKKCRYTSFVFLVDGDTTPHLLAFLGKELETRTA